MSLSFRTIGGGDLAVALNGTQRDVMAGAEIGMRRTVAGGASIVRGKASGRPGPRVITGDYRRSISGDIVERSPGRVVGQIGTNAAQARRLEYGFVGPDSLGRVYNQPAYPHFSPSEGEIADLAVRQIGQAISEALK